MTARWDGDYIGRHRVEILTQRSTGPETHRAMGAIHGAVLVRMEDREDMALSGVVPNSHHRGES